MTVAQLFVEYVEYILEGKPINKYSKNGLKFTDSNLAKELDKEFPNSYKLYVDMCEYIHFSITHIEQIKTKSDNPKAKFLVVIGDSDNFTLDRKIDFANSMVTVNNNLLSLLKNWPKEKNIFLGGIKLI